MLKEMLTSDQLSLVISQGRRPPFCWAPWRPSCPSWFRTWGASSTGRARSPQFRITMPKERISRGICPNCTFAQA